MWEFYNINLFLSEFYKFFILVFILRFAMYSILIVLMIILVFVCIIMFTFYNMKTDSIASKLDGHVEDLLDRSVIYYISLMT